MKLRAKLRMKGIAMNDVLLQLQYETVRYYVRRKQDSNECVYIMAWPLARLALRPHSDYMLGVSATEDEPNHVLIELIKVPSDLKKLEEVEFDMLPQTVRDTFSHANLEEIMKTMMLAWSNADIDEDID